MENIIINDVDNNVSSLEENINTDFENILKQIGALKGNITNIQNSIKGLEKKIKKNMKANSKLTKTKQNNQKKPSGFAKPSKISDELCEFLNLSKGSEIARTEVTKRIISYVTTNNLQCEENRKQIKCDEKLEKLLNVKEGDEITYFNIQRYMNPHFIKKTNVINFD